MELRKVYSIAAFIVLPFYIPSLHFYPTPLSQSLKKRSYAFLIVIIYQYDIALRVVMELIDG